MKDEAFETLRNAAIPSWFIGCSLTPLGVKIIMIRYKRLENLESNDTTFKLFSFAYVLFCYYLPLFATTKKQVICSADLELCIPPPH